MGTEVRLYKAVVWPSKEEKTGARIEVMAASLEEAEATLKAKYGSDIAYSLWNGEDASRPR